MYKNYRLHYITCTYVGHQKPSLKFLNRHVRGPVGAKWHDLGIELLDPDVEELDRIEAEGSSDLNKCCTKMFQLWLNKQSTASWNQLIEALRQPSTNLGALAGKIKQMLSKPEPKGQLCIISLIMSH